MHSHLVPTCFFNKDVSTGREVLGCVHTDVHSFTHQNDSAHLLRSFGRIKQPPLNTDACLLTRSPEKLMFRTTSPRNHLSAKQDSISQN